MRVVMGVVIFLSAAILHASASASDWAQFRGPAHDGQAAKGAFALWPSGAAPKKLWSAQVGAGSSSVIVAGGRVFAQGNNGSEALDKENKSQDTIYCFDAETGKELWKQSFDAPFLRVSDAGGPNATPASDGECVVTLGKTNVVRCFEAATGKLRWARNFAEESKVDPAKFAQAFIYGGMACSPVIVGDVVLIGGLGLEKATGKTRYQVKIEKGNLSRYVSPTPVTFDGKTEIATGFQRYPRQGLVFFDPATGEVRRELLCRVGSGDPLMVDGRIFISDRAAKDGGGGSCLYDAKDLTAPALVATDKPLPPEFAKPAPKPAAAEKPADAPPAPAAPAKGEPPAPLWRVGDDGSYWGNAVRWGDCIFTGDMKSMTCIDLKTGAVKWREKSLTNVQPIVCDGMVLVMKYNVLMVLEAGPEYKVLASAEVLPATSSNPYAKFSTTPALVAGRLYCKQSNGDLVCLDVSGK
ncbi:MAG: PQQ-binding-like beta-propeller repeat protein [Planctomycetota bacterium]|nr:PQQ-binding-like beta-propeller repeat protein [Planctomycetota bacterium]